MILAERQRGATTAETKGSLISVISGQKSSCSHSSKTIETLSLLADRPGLSPDSCLRVFVVLNTHLTLRWATQRWAVDTARYLGFGECGIRDFDKR